MQVIEAKFWVTLNPDKSISKYVENPRTGLIHGNKFPVLDLDFKLHKFLIINKIGVFQLVEMKDFIYALPDEEVKEEVKTTKGKKQ